MSTEREAERKRQAARESGMSRDDAIRAMLVLMPRVAQRLKRTTVPEQLRSMNLAPRHLSLLSHLVFDGPALVNELAARLEVAPTTVSLMVADLSRQGVVERKADPSDRRRTIVSLTEDPETREAINSWLARGADAWEKALDPLTPQERAIFVRTMEAYESGASGATD
ncbi:MarR family winged helix-turn-helix transcriptional regulator [Streptomyces sp. CBMA152]|uniref:MarR family winged helix-turn-helix transcriptional regulator n=1 Tax=unclassified Streptomyces TaxID=2593676 RepID=UPI001CB6FFE6|nr:MarR family winged helix-turn-helix transcriptional regulator [Streptomyces sp. CBMA152]